MNGRIHVLKIVGILCAAGSITMLPPILVSLWYHDGRQMVFVATFLGLLAVGMLLWLPFRHSSGELRRRDGFLIVALFWIVLSFASALPFFIGPQLSLVDSLFEATSGFTTTGATVITDLEKISPSVLYYRQQLQWLGGVGLVVLAVAVLPILGVGGAQLYRAETPGPMKEERLTPRLSKTARNLWSIYVALTAAAAVAYWIAGMAPLDALEHSFATVSTGGFSPHNESLAFFRSTSIELIAVVFMLLGGINFGVHFVAWRKRSFRSYLHDAEVRAFLLFVVVLVVLYASVLLLTGSHRGFVDALVTSLFEVTSMVTTTGFGVVDFSVWPLFLPVMMIFLSFVGGCGGSTAGGIKFMRVMLLVKQAAREANHLIHPKLVRPIRIGKYPLRERTVESIWAFFSVYIAVFATLTLLMMMAGLDQVSAFSAVAASINNLGPGLGEVSASFAHVSSAAKLLAVAAMLLGRLEIFTLLVLLTPDFWRS